MIKYSREFFKKSFTADTMKNAYMKAAKWVASEIISDKDFINVHIQYVKEKEEIPTITVHLFSVQDGEKDVMSHHCECCREMHRSFFINEDTNCNRCSALGFQNRLEEKIAIKRDWYRDILRRKGVL